MATPWRASTPKHVGRITSERVFRKRHAFVAPALHGSLRFSRAAFSLAMARTSAQSGFPVAAMNSLVQVMNSLLKDHVDDAVPHELQFQQSVLSFADATRSYFSSCVGAAFADLYAQRLGYRLVANSRDVLGLLPGQVGDFLYGGGPAGRSGAVMVEAKGSLKFKFSAGAFMATVRKGYQKQVRRHIGRVCKVSNGQSFTIVHGYGIGCGAQLPLADAIAHVVEPSQPDIGGPGGGPTRASVPVSPRGPAPMSLALSNYRGAAILLGLPWLVEAIDAALRTREPRPRLEPGMEEREWRGQSFYVGRSAPLVDRESRTLLQFAIWKPAMDQLLDALSRPRDTWNFEDDAPGARGDFDEEGAVSSDGLALITHQMGVETLDPPGLKAGVRVEDWRMEVPVVTTRAIPVRRPIQFDLTTPGDDKVES